MTKPKHIPAGYLLTITSWENDSDHHKDQTFSGLTKGDVKFLVELAKLFRSMNRHDGGYGGSARHYRLNKRGTGDRDTDLAVEINFIIEKHAAHVSPELREAFKLDHENFGEEGWFDQYNKLIVIPLVSFPGEEYGDESYIRVYEGHTVHFVESLVKDVTKEFK